VPIANRPEISRHAHGCDRLDALAIALAKSCIDERNNVVMLGLPQGLLIDVDLDAKVCRSVILE